MFYSYDVLNSRTGRLSVLWLAATNVIKYSKKNDKNFKEVMSVAVDEAW